MALTLRTSEEVAKKHHEVLEHDLGLVQGAHQIYLAVACSMIDEGDHVASATNGRRPEHLGVGMYQIARVGVLVFR